MIRIHLPAWAGCIAVAALLSACGGGGPKSVSNAAASGARYAGTMTVTFNGLGLNEGVEVRFSGPCENPQRVAGATTTTLQYTCKANGVGRVTASLTDTGDGVVYGALAIDVPLPRFSMTVTDGTRAANVVLELDPRAAPKTVEQFVEYANAGFYNDTLFHRVNPKIAILGGGFVSDTAGIISAKLPTRAPLALEKTGLRNVRGAIAMYREGGPNSANSMFFINTVDNPRFDAGSTETPDGYAVFGNVVSGLDSVDNIANVPVRPDLSLGVTDVPVTNVRIGALLQTR
ncbi:MAG: peptidylprolyl isomerase [Rubrivivax sp.]